MQAGHDEKKGRQVGGDTLAAEDVRRQSALMEFAWMVWEGERQSQGPGEGKRANVISANTVHQHGTNGVISGATAPHVGITLT